MEARRSMATGPIVRQGRRIDWIERSSIDAASPATGRDPDRNGDRAQLADWQAKLAKKMMVAQVHRPVSLSDIAGRLGMTVNHFSKAFRSTVGVAPYHWFMQLRIAQSLELLKNEDLAISKIASDCGFVDQSHFSKAFRRLLGVSPGRWRRRFKVGMLTAGEQQLAGELRLISSVP